MQNFSRVEQSKKQIESEPVSKTINDMVDAWLVEEKMEITQLVESAQYITNYHGQQMAVMLPIDIWDRLLEVLQNGEEQTEGVEDRIMGDDGIPSIAEVVARIKATPPNPAVKFATGSVDDLTPSDPDAEFDLEAWERDWGAAMEEMRRSNYIAYRNKGRI